MTSNEVRTKFIEFFKERGHKVIPSASLVPENDPTVLFTTAGMHPFKRFYLFPKEAPASRIVTVQKCVRTGDIEEVGDSTHLTFFEMLGNFTFGYQARTNAEKTQTGAESIPYFKEDSITWAWEFLTKELGVDILRLSATYFAGEDGIPADTESYELLKQITKLPEDKIEGTGKDETFWSLGTEGSPGGPTVEFYIDGIEIWNLVFNEYVMRDGKYVASELKGVDTGMGLERLLAVIDGKNDVYETDLFEDLILKVEELSGKKYSDFQKEFRIITDHLKTAVLMIGDCVIPSNKDRGYVLRRIIRRAIVKAKQIGIEKDFCAELATEVVKKYDRIYQQMFVPGVSEEELDQAVLKDRSEKINSQIIGVIVQEEKKFRANLANGLKLIQSNDDLSAKDLFDLYQSYGIPVEVSIEEAERLGRKVSHETVEQLNNLVLKHQELSRTASAGMFKGGLADNKEETTRLHTAAHLLLAALRQVLSSDVNQKGSNITEERLRFDFNHSEKMTPEQILEVEKIVNEKIKENISVEMEELSLADAKASGATGVFDDRYGAKVKVYTIGSFSKEICGGPHVKNTSELGHFKIKKEESSSAGVRRIKAILE